MAATSAPSSADLPTTSDVERDSEPALDVQVLKDAAKKALINVLNSASFSTLHACSRSQIFLGEWCKDVRA